MKPLQALFAVFACAVLPLHAAPPTAIDLGILGDKTSVVTLDTIGSAVGDTELGVYDAAGNLLEDNDDIGGGILHSEVVVGSLAEGTYYAAVSAYNTSFGPADFAVSGGGVSGRIVLNYSDGLDVAGTATGSLDGADGVDGVAWFSFEIEVQRAVTLTALQQERTYGDALTLDETAFSVLDLDGDAALPNGEVIDTVALSSVTGIDASTTANVGTYADEIAITGQNGSNGFEAGNYDLSYVVGDLVVNQRAVTLTALQQERTYGDGLTLEETAFSVLDLDGDASLPNGEQIDTVALNSVTGVDASTTANVGTYADEIAITGQNGSNGFEAGNYDLSYVAGGLVVNQRAVTLTALQQERTYGDALNLDGTAFSVLDLDGDASLSNGEVIDTVNLVSAGGVDQDTTASAQLYLDNLTITGQNGSGGFDATNYDITYLLGNFEIERRPVVVTATQQERIYGDPLTLDETAFSVLDLDHDAALPNGEVIDTVNLVSAGGVDQDTTASAGSYLDNIVITGENGSNGFGAGNYDLSYIANNLVVNQRAVILTTLQQERTYGDPLILDETAFSVLDLVNLERVLPNGEVIDTVNLVSAGGVDQDTTASAGSYLDNIVITGENGSNGFGAGNYDLSYIANNLVVNQRAVTLTTLQQERTYGDPLSLDETAFSVLDLDGDASLPNGEVIDTVNLVSAGGVDQDTTASAGSYLDNITSSRGRTVPMGLGPVTTT